MEIRDVIGQLRLTDLELQRAVDALRLRIHMLEWELGRAEKPSATTESEPSEKESPNETKPGRASYPSPTPQTGVGKNLRRRNP